MIKYFFRYIILFSNRIYAMDLLHGAHLFMLKIFLLSKKEQFEPLLVSVSMIPPLIPLKCKILTLDKLYRSKLASFMWDFDHGVLPNHLQKFFKYSSDGYGTRSSANANLAENISCEIKVGSLMLKFMGPKVLNSLKNLSFYNLIHTKKSFISKYKNYLLDSPN